MNYGKRYRLLRIKQGFSLVKASDGIVSEPTLSRWENGKGPMDIERIPALLKRINCTIDDLFLLENDKIEKEIKQLFNDNDEQGLHQLTQNLLVVFDQRLYDYDSLFYVVMACNYYQKLTEQNMLTDLAIRKLTSKLTSINIWTENNISLVNIALPLIDDSLLLNVAINIRNKFPNISKESNNTVYRVLDIYIRSIYYLIEKGCYDKAYLLLQHSEAITWPDYCCNLEIKFEFYKYLLNFKITGNSKEMNSFLAELNKHKLGNLI